MQNYNDLDHIMTWIATSAVAGVLAACHPAPPVLRLSLRILFVAIVNALAAG